MRTATQAELLRNVGILDKWHDKSFDGFDNDAAAKKRVVSYLENINEAVKDGIGLYLYGANGRGKTHLIMCLLKEIVLETRFTVRAVTLGTLISMYTSGWRDEEAKYEFDLFIRKPTFLEIEEIGKEYKQGSNDLGRTVLDTVVRYRLQAKKCLLFTTNVPPDKISDIYTPDIASMLNEACLGVEVFGEDKRNEIHKQFKDKYNF